MIALNNVAVRYPAAEMPALRDFSLALEPGQTAAIHGRNRAGKSTLLRLLAGIVTRVFGAQITGRAVVAGIDLSSEEPDIFDRVGMLTDSPWSQVTFLKGTVRGEIELCLESRGWHPTEIGSRVTELIERFELRRVADRAPTELSGGELQRTALACALAHRPRVLVLDEPELHLDPGMLHSLAIVLAGESAAGKTVVFSTHRKAGLLPDATQIYLPHAASDQDADRQDRGMPEVPDGPEEILRFHDVSYRYANGTLAVEGIDLVCRAGEATALVGPNGAGKTTLAKLALGLLRPKSGRVLVNGRDIREKRASNVAQTVGLAFQNPGEQLFHGSVKSELEFGPKIRRFAPARAEQAIRWAASLAGLDWALAENPYDLSWSERRLLTIACVAATEPRLLLLDEPTAGLDDQQRQRVIDLIGRWRSAGGGVLAITHDLAFARDACTRTQQMSAGRLEDGD